MSKELEGTGLMPDYINKTAELRLSEGIIALRDNFMRSYAESGMRLYYLPELAKERDEAIRIAYSNSEESPVILRRSRVLEIFAGTCSTPVSSLDYLLGTQLYNCPGFPNGIPDPEYAATTGHIVHDYPSLLKLGISGLIETITDTSVDNLSQKNAKQAYIQALEALQVFIARNLKSIPDDALFLKKHISETESLLTAPPATFYAAVQLVWFAHILLHIENPSVAISFGRMDQYLNLFLEKDLTDNRITLQEAYDILCAFLLKCCEGEESQNVVIGGAGHENLVSYLLLAAMKNMRTMQPSISVRIGSETSDDFMQACCELAAAGTGNPGFMNEDRVTQSLINTGIEPADAADWSVVGCYEATVSGKCYPNTVLGGLNLTRLLTDFVCGLRSLPETFEDLVKETQRYIAVEYERHLARVENTWRHFRKNAQSPLGSVLMHGSREKLVPLECGGAPYNLVGINMMGLGSLVDGLMAIKHTVYDTKQITLNALKEAVAANFDNEHIRSMLRKAKGDSSSNTRCELIQSVSEGLARMVLDSRIVVDSDQYGPSAIVQPYASFFGFGADIYDTEFASVDGRRAGELISYGVAPALSAFTSATAALQSASCAAQHLAACGSPFALTLAQPEANREVIGSLVRGYFASGGFHLHINIADPNILRETMLQPEKHADVMVRVSGFSAKFVTLDRKWQEALIQRAEKGH